MPTPGKAKEEEVQKTSKTYEEMLEKMKSEISQGQVTISELKGKLTVNMLNAILFDSGKAEVKPEGLAVLQKVIDILKTVKDKAIRIEGHTDNVPIIGALARKYPSNWELSAARAINVTRYLQQQGIDPALLGRRCLRRIQAGGAQRYRRREGEEQKDRDHPGAERVIPVEIHPTAALRCILRHCGVPYVRLIPQDLRALHLGLFERESDGKEDISCCEPRKINRYFVACRTSAMENHEEKKSTAAKTKGVQKLSLRGSQGGAGGAGGRSADKNDTSSRARGAGR